MPILNLGEIYGVIINFNAFYFFKNAKLPKKTIRIRQAQE